MPAALFLRLGKIRNFSGGRMPSLYARRDARRYNALPRAKAGSRCACHRSPNESSALGGA